MPSTDDLSPQPRLNALADRCVCIRIRQAQPHGVPVHIIIFLFLGCLDLAIAQQYKDSHPTLKSSPGRTIPTIPHYSFHFSLVLICDPLGSFFRTTQRLVSSFSPVVSLHRSITSTLLLPPSFFYKTSVTRAYMDL